MRTWRVVIGYVLASGLAIALVFVALVPIWQMWVGNVSGLSDDASTNISTLTELFQRDGAAAVAAAVRAQAKELPGDRYVLFGSPERNVLAGTLTEWPAAAPDRSLRGFRILVNVGGHEVSAIATQEMLPGGYRLLMARNLVPLSVIRDRVLYGMGGSLGALILIGAGLAWWLARQTAVLRRSEERHALAMRASGEGHWDWQIERDEFYVSPRYLEIGGFPPGTRFSTRGEFLERLPFHPDDRRKYEAAVAAHFAGQTPRIDMGIRILRDDGLRWLHVIGMCSRDAAGKPVRWGGSVSDITERKNAELALAASEGRYALAMEAAGDGHTDWNLLSGEHYISPRLLEICGYAPGTTFRDREEWVRRFPFHPEDRPMWERAIAEHFAGQESHFKAELRIVVRDEVRWTAFHFLSTRDVSGKVVRWTGSIGDITESKRAEHALRESEERYALAVAGSDDGVWDVDFNAGTVFVSARARELVGMPPGPERMPMDDWLATLPIHPDDVPRRTMAFQDHLDGKAPAYVGEFRLRQSDGVYRWRRLHGLCLRDGQGKPHRMAGSISDIDARKRAEDALRLSEERYALALEASEEGHFDNDLHSNQIFVSARLNEIYGFPAQSETLDRYEFVNRIPFFPDDRERVVAELSKHDWADPLGDLYEIECRIVPRPGEVRWIHSRAKVLRDAAGRPRRRVGVVTDITARKRAAEALRLSQERYALAMEASEEGHFDHNLDTEEMFVSERLNAIYGFPRGERVHNRLAYMARVPFHEDDKEDYEAAIRATVLPGAPPRYEHEYRIVRSPGEVRWLRTCGIITRDSTGHAIRRTGLVADITQSKVAEEALRLSEERYALAMEVSEEGHFDWNVRTDEIFASEHMKKLLGLPLDFVYRTRHDVLAQVHYASFERERVDDIDRRALTSDAVQSECEYRILRGAEERWLRRSWKINRDASGAAIRVIGVVTDITQRKLAEEGLRKMERELRQAQRLESIGTLAGGIAHDFNNILGAILGYGEMAMRDAKEGTRLHRDLDSIMAAGERGRALVDRILAFSRSGVGDRIPVHVEAVVREALDQIAAKLPENVTIRPSLRAGRAAMLGDSTQVHQVVMNLASNAVQAMPHGGALRVSLVTKRIEGVRPSTVGAIAVGDYIVLEVSDTGSGISDDVLERMFDPFFTTKEVGVGSGLGLSLVHGIVTSAGGAIDVTTKPGRGSTFTVYLRRTGDVGEQPADDHRPLPCGEGQRVLVIDDEEPLVRLASETLAQLGYAPVGFTSSTRAMQAFVIDPRGFDAILTDERMPGMTGSTLIQQVRRINASIPILLMSGFISSGAAARARELGANDVLKKPLLARELATSLARALHS